MSGYENYKDTPDKEPATDGHPNKETTMKLLTLALLLSAFAVQAAMPEPSLVVIQDDLQNDKFVLVCEMPMETNGKVTDDVWKTMTKCVRVPKVLWAERGYCDAYEPPRFIECAP